MNKKILSLLFTLIILLSNAIPVYATTSEDYNENDGIMLIDEAGGSDFAVFDNEHYCVDDADLLDDYERSALEYDLLTKSEELNFDIVIVTTNTLDGKTPEAYADDYYDYNGYGYGDSHDGCLLLVSMEDRDWHISTTGFGITALTDYGLDYISDQFLGDLSEGYYYGAFDTFATEVQAFVLQAQSGEAYDVDNKVVGDKKSFSLESVGIGVIAGLIIALIFVSMLKSKMNSVAYKATADDYLVPNSLVITNQYDRFITTHVTKKAKPKQSSGGSSTHSGSSGTSHGGSGGKF